MKHLHLLIWLTQFGLSILFPIGGFLLLGVWLQSKFSLGSWIILLCIILGLLTAVSTVRTNLRTMCLAADKAAPPPPPTIAFNDHE